MTERHSDNEICDSSESIRRGFDGPIRSALELGVGLGLLGVQQFKAQEKELAADLERAGLAQAASAVRLAGRLMDPPLRWLVKRASGNTR